MKSNPPSTSSQQLLLPFYPSSNNYMFFSKLMFFFITKTFFLSFFFVHVFSSCNQLDKDSLLSFSSKISSFSSLNWSSSSDCCNWEGITCDQNHQHVTQIFLPSRGLNGFIEFSSITSLQSLSHVNLSHNKLRGNLQNHFFSLVNHVLVLDLSYNHFYGGLPSSNGSGNGNNSVVIQELDLSSNSFNGSLPVSLIQILAANGNLISFNVSNNSFTGHIPFSSFCTNNSAIRFLDFSSNDFVGVIDTGLGACSKLERFRAGFNFLTGNIPVDIYDAVSLTEISVPLNRINGTIDDGIVNLTNLTVLELYSNNLTGSIPKEIGKLSKLERLLLHVNNLTGPIPSSLMNCHNLVVLNLRVNDLEGNLSAFNFSGLVRLVTLDLGNNRFSGVLPPSLYDCKSLAALRLASNQLEGQVSSEILELESLSFLSISKNMLKNITGALRILTGLKKLSTLMLSKNFYNETLPNDANVIGPDGFQKIQVLGLGGCNFTGQIPSWLERLKKLEAVDLSYNLLSGSIPPWLGTLSELFYIDLSVNLLTGPFPIELTKLPALASQQANDKVERTYLELPVFANANNVSLLQYNQLSSLPPAIYLGTNHLNGSIPIEVGQLKVLHTLDLKLNNFSGNIPDQLSNLNNLETLDLSGNQLSGEIPASLNNLHFLSFFSVANNNLQGQIPTGGQFNTFSNSSFEGNPQLCGLVIQHPCSSQKNATSTSVSSKSSKKLIVILIIAVSFGIATMVTLLTLWILSKRRVNPRGDSDKIELESISPYSNSGVHPEVDREASLVVLFPNKNNETKDLCILEIIKATENFSQANIVGCGGFGLVYKATFQNGTKLAIKKLSGDLGLMEREFKAEVEALSTAQHENLVALQGYCVHDGYRLLIYNYMENGSLDYWLHEKSDGTLGYIPPEYGQAWVATLRGDVYSFGVVLLELLTGRRPMDVCKPKISRELVSWVQQMKIEGKQEQVFDPNLRGKGFEAEMLYVLDVACMCVNMNPFKRPRIREVVEWLKNVGSENQLRNND
ncbi:Tyrosine-sulfated glycopeptide receptor 1 [Trifolium repens]|nr:Tyrosine-sulfated glycopeptide receptor 1 [Trifolium repens]